MILIKLILLIAGVLGLTISLITLRNHKSNQILNIYFILFLGIISLRQLGIGISTLFFNHFFMENYYMYSSFTILVLPILYLYLKKLSSDIDYFDWKEILKNAAFPMVFILFETFINSDTRNSNFKIILYLIPFLFSSFYTYLCFQLVSKKNWSKKEYQISKPQSDLLNSWTQSLFLIISLTPLKSLMLLLMKLNEKEMYPHFNFHPGTSIVILIICIKILSKPEIFYGYNILHSKISENRKWTLILENIWCISTETKPTSIQDSNLKSRIDSNILSYIEKIEKKAFENESLIISEVTISDFANQLAIPKSHLVYLFKYHSSVSFIEFKKIIRIHYATKLIQDDFLKTKTLNSLSKKVGFSSYDPFYRSFKEITGNGPLDYYRLCSMK